VTVSPPLRRLEEALARVRDEFRSGAAGAKDAGALAALRNRILGRKAGLLTLALKGLKEIPDTERPAAGEAANRLRAEIEAGLDEAARALGEPAPRAGAGPQALDATLPGVPPPLGAIHPVTLVRREIEQIFLEMGYTIEEGPEVESDWYNFEALNIPPDHPARDMQDTFYVEGGGLLRTHTSPIQIRTMQKVRPPLKMIALGKVYRRDSDISHSPMFHQVEGLVVGERVSLGDLKGTIRQFTSRLFRRDVRVRLRPGYFPFVEPGAEFDVTCILCGGEGCRTCKRTGWLEMGGAGMVHPNVFEMVGYDPAAYSGFAFGLGVDRIAMLRYAVDDIRVLFENDLRFIHQFRGEL
jgi:phenylalanyl-tRNA synthetase alpha chain